MRVVITGATGFIGRHVARRFSAIADSVVALGRKPCGLPGIEELVITDFSEDSLGQAMQGRSFDILLHLAAAGVHPGERNSALLFEVNALAPARLIRWAGRHGAKAAVVAGSSAEYATGDSQLPLTEEHPLETERAYGATKAAGSLLALAQGHACKLPVAVLRLFNVYGPGEAPHRLLPSLIDGARTRTPTRLSAGTQVRDFVHVDDAVAAFECVATQLESRSDSAGIYNVATGDAHAVADFARTAARLLEMPLHMLQFDAIPMRKDDLPVLVGDPSRLRETFGWSPSVALEAGIDLAIRDATAVIANRWV